MIIYNTSFRRIKVYLYIPIALFELTFSKIFNLVPYLNFKYDVLAAKLDTDRSLPQDTKTKDDWVELNVKDIKNKKLRYSLYLSGIFKKWYVYYTRNIGVRDYNKSDNNRDVIYISKEKLNISEGIYIGERISETDLNKKYNTNKLSKYLKRLNLKYDEFYKIEPQMYAIAALRTERHEIMQKERNIIYAKKKDKSLEKVVNKMIKDENLFSHSSTYGDYSDLPVFHKLVKANRIDLVKKVLLNAEDDDERCNLVNYKASREYVQDSKPMDCAKTDEMKKLLEKWMDLTKYDRYRKIMKIKKGIK